VREDAFHNGDPVTLVHQGHVAVDWAFLEVFRVDDDLIEGLEGVEDIDRVLHCGSTEVKHMCSSLNS